MSEARRAYRLLILLESRHSAERQQAARSLKKLLDRMIARDYSDHYKQYKRTIDRSDNQEGARKAGQRLPKHSEQDSSTRGGQVRMAAKLSFLLLFPCYLTISFIWTFLAHRSIIQN